MYWGKDKNISFFYLFHIRSIYFIIRAKIRFYFETNKKIQKKLRKKAVTTGERYPSLCGSQRQRRGGVYQHLLIYTKKPAF